MTVKENSGGGQKQTGIGGPQGPGSGFFTRLVSVSVSRKTCSATPPSARVSTVTPNVWRVRRGGIPLLQSSESVRFEVRFILLVIQSTRRPSSPPSKVSLISRVPASPPPSVTGRQQSLLSSHCLGRWTQRECFILAQGSQLRRHRVRETGNALPSLPVTHNISNSIFNLASPHLPQ